MSPSEVPREALIEFVYRETRLLDEKRFADWLELTTEDVLYWMPLARGQPPGDANTSLFYEDRLLLKVRIERLAQPNAFSQQQPSFCQHVLQAPAVESADPAQNRYVLRTPFVYVESQLDRQNLFAGIAWHHLTMARAGLRMRMKKIELLNCDAALPSIQLLL